MSPAERRRRGRLLYVALALLGLDLPPAARPSGLRALHAGLDTWHGIGLIEHGLARQDRDLELIRYGDRWGAGVYWTWTRIPDRPGYGMADYAVGCGATGRVPCAPPGRILE